MTTLDIYEDTKFFPAVVALEVTLRCNMRCLHCGSEANGDSRKNELSLDEWKGVVDELIQLGCGYFTLSGGEPFVWEHWRELSSYICEKGKILSIISNGYSITDDDITFLEKVGIWNIGLSVDGLRETHDKIRQKEGAFVHVVNAIKHFRAKGVKTVVSTSVNRMNVHDLRELKYMLNVCGVNLWQVQVVNSFGRAGKLKEEMILDYQQYAELVKFIHSSQQEHKAGTLKMNVMPADSIGYCHELAQNIWGDMDWCGCNAGRYVIGIKSDGDVVGCLSLQHDDFIAGNVRERKLADIWNDDEAFHYNRNFDVSKLNGSCRNCSFGAQCRSGCLGMGYSVSGKLYNNPYCYKHITESAKL